MTKHRMHTVDSAYNTATLPGTVLYTTGKKCVCFEASFKLESYPSHVSWSASTAVLVPQNHLLGYCHFNQLLPAATFNEG